MAIAVVQHTSNSSVASATTVAVTISATAANSLVVVGCSAWDVTRTVSSVSDGTNTYTQATGAASVGFVAGGVDFWYFLKVGSGITTVTITFSGAAGTFDKQGIVWEVSGFVNAAFNLAGVVQTSGSGTTDTGASVTTSLPGFAAGLIGVQTTEGSIVANPQGGNSFTSGGDITSSLHAAGCSKILSSGGAQQPVWTDGFSSHNFNASTVTFKEPSLVRFNNRGLRPAPFAPGRAR